MLELSALEAILLKDLAFCKLLVVHIQHEFNNNFLHLCTEHTFESLRCKYSKLNSILNLTIEKNVQYGHVQWFCTDINFQKESVAYVLGQGSKCKVSVGLDLDFQGQKAAFASPILFLREYDAI